jgi:hypothetical protein
MSAINWLDPTVLTLVLDFPAAVVTRFNAIKTMSYDVGDTNHVVGTKRLNTGTTPETIQTWNGMAWVDAMPHITGHVNSTLNPHNTTAVQVGAPDLIMFNGHTGRTDNPHNTTATQVGAPTVAAFNAHTANLSNPHNVTAAQAGALAKTLNLSDLSDAPAARNNIAAASAATLSAHVTNTSNPHATTPEQIGALKIANYLTEIAALGLLYQNTARAQLLAAAAGTNFDITSMGGCSSFSVGTAMTFGTSTSSPISFYVNNNTRGMIIQSPTGNVVPYLNNLQSFGSPTNYWSSIYTVGMLGYPGVPLNLLGDLEVDVSNNTTGALCKFNSVGVPGMKPGVGATYVGSSGSKFSGMWATVYSTFTGCHPVADVAPDVQIGDVVSLIAGRIAVKTTRENSAACFGIYHGRSDNQHLVAALGDTEADPVLGWPCVNHGGPILIGTRLVASVVPGKVKAREAQHDEDQPTLGKAFDVAEFDDSGMAIVYGIIYTG